METRTTAQLRDQAREAEQRGHYLTASELYELAAARYPDGRRSRLACADIDGLLASARQCRSFHRIEQTLPRCAS